MPRHQLSYAGRTLLSFFSFYLGWWTCALGPVYGYPWAGPLLIPFWAGAHIYFSPIPKGEALFLFLMAAIGLLVDSLLIRMQVFSTVWVGVFAPPWLVSMWVLLGLTFQSMLMMRRHRLLLYLCGLTCGPLSYFFAEAVDVLNYSRPLWASMGTHGLLWAVLMPRLFELRDWCLRDTIQRHSGD